MNAITEALAMDRRTNGSGLTDARPAVKRLHFFDTVRNIAMLAVILYHAVAAYSTATPHWSVHDGTFLVADGIRHLFDVFMMPLFFFVAGFFALPALNRRGPRDFLKGKGKRIGIPWLIAILLLVPMVRYAGEMKAEAVAFIPFRQYWLEYCAGVGTVRFGPASADTMSQMHFWFLSLLLAFFLILAAVRAIPAGRRVLAGDTAQPVSTRSIYATLAWTAGCTAPVYFVLVSVVPEASWTSIDLLLQFQPASLILYVACFVLGLLAARGGWFAGNAFPGRPLVWGMVSAALAVLFLATGKGVFTEPLTADGQPALVLGAFSLARTLLCLSMLLSIIAYARGRNRVSVLGGKLAAGSYGIYLCHLFFVVFLQDVLMVWAGGAPMAKAAVVFLTALPISYGVARAMDRFPKSFAIGLGAVFVLVVVLCR